MKTFVSLVVLGMFGANVLLPFSAAAEAWMETRKKMVEELRSERDQVKNESGEEIDMSTAESVCLNEDDTISACRKAVRRVRKELAEKRKGEDVVIAVNGGQYKKVQKKGKDPRFD